MHISKTYASDGVYHCREGGGFASRPSYIFYLCRFRPLLYRVLIAFNEADYPRRKLLQFESPSSRLENLAVNGVASVGIGRVSVVYTSTRSHTLIGLSREKTLSWCIYDRLTDLYRRLSRDVPESNMLCMPCSIRGSTLQIISRHVYSVSIIDMLSPMEL